MRYIIIQTDYPLPVVYTPYFDLQNTFVPNVGMIVIDTSNYMYTDDGVDWQECEFDHL